MPYRLRVLAAWLVALLVFPLVTRAQTFWTAGTGDWFTPSNWSAGVPSQTGGANLDAVIANSGTAQILTNAGASVRRLRVGRAEGPGNLQIGGSLTVSSDLYVNENGVGPSSVTVQTTSPVTVPTTIIGYQSNFPSSFTLSGAGTSYSALTDFQVGRAGSGLATLTLQSGAAITGPTATIAALSGSTGTATITGTGSQWSTTSTFTVGSGGNGSLTVQSGGALTVGTTLTVGTGTFGTLNIQPTANVNVASTLSIGGLGTVNLAGGSLRTNSVSKAGSGAFNFTAGTLDLPGARDFFTDPTIPAVFGANPTLGPDRALIIEGDTTVRDTTFTVDGGSFSSSGTLALGSNTDPGTMTVQNGGAVSVGAFSNLVSSGAASLTITGAGTTFTTAGNFTFRDNGTLNTLNIQSGATLYVGSQLYLSSNGTGTTLNVTGGTLRLNSLFNAAIIHFNSGTLQLGGSRTIDTDPALLGVFGSPFISANKTVAIESTATVSPGGTFTLSGGTLTAPTLILSQGATLAASTAATATGTAAAAVLGNAGSTIDASTANFIVGDPAKPNGFYSNGTLLVGPSHTLTLRDANDAVLDAASLTTLGSATTAGTLAAPSGLTLNFGGNVTGYGTLSTPNDPTKPLINNGHITGTDASHKLTLTGYVKGVGTLDNVTVTGTLAPGFSPATVYYGSMDYQGTLSIDIASPTSYDVLHHSGPVTLAGNLQLVVSPGVNPASLANFQFLTAPSVTGTFSSITGNLPDATHAYAPLFTPTGLSFLATLPGDANLDGVLSADDYALLDRSLAVARTNPRWTDGDFNSDGTVNYEDYLIIDAAYLTLHPSAADAVLANRASQFGPDYVTTLLATVPEPTSLLAACGFALLPLAGRRHRACTAPSPFTVQNTNFIIDTPGPRPTTSPRRAVRATRARDQRGSRSETGGISGLSDGIMAHADWR